MLYPPLRTVEGISESSIRGSRALDIRIAHVSERVNSNARTLGVFITTVTLVDEHGRHHDDRNDGENYDHSEY